MSEPNLVLETLKATRELLTPPERWTKGGHYRVGPKSRYAEIFPDYDHDDPDYQVKFMKDLDPAGLCFCIEGAVYRSAPDHKTAEKVVNRLTDQMRKTHVFHSLVCWNDFPNRTHADVIELLDKTIAS